MRCDGTDFIDSYRTLGEAAEYVRRERKPAFVHAKVIRPYSHSLSDDERLYKTPDERKAEALRDPLTKMRAFLQQERIATEADLEAVLQSVDREIAESTELALKAPKPSVDSAASFVFSPTVDPSSNAFLTSAQPEGKPDTMVSAINRTMKDEMAKNPRIVVFGEDVADASKASALPHVPGKGGVFKVTHGLQKAYGADRVFNSPLAEQHRRPRRRHGDARLEACGRDPVLRLHLAGDDAAQGRDVDAALSVGQQLVVPDGRARADRRLPARRRAVSQPVRRQHFRALPRGPYCVPKQRGSTPPACCAPRFVATTRCSISNTSTSIARRITRVSIPARTT